MELEAFVEVFVDNQSCGLRLSCCLGRPEREVGYTVRPRNFSSQVYSPMLLSFIQSFNAAIQGFEPLLSSQAGKRNAESRDGWIDLWLLRAVGKLRNDGKKLTDAGTGASMELRIRY